VVELLSDGGYSPLDLQGDFTRQEVWLLRQSVLWYAYRAAVLQFPQRVSELLSFLQVSDHVASVLSPVPPSHAARLLSPLRTPEYCARCFFESVSTDGQFPAPQTAQLCQQPAGF
jgi:hypothetical protein